MYTAGKKRKRVQYSLCLLYRQTNVAYACNNKHSHNPSGTQLAYYQHSHTPLIENIHFCQTFCAHSGALVFISMLISLHNGLNHVLSNPGLASESHILNNALK